MRLLLALEVDGNNRQCASAHVKTARGRSNVMYSNTSQLFWQTRFKAPKHVHKHIAFLYEYYMNKSHANETFNDAGYAIEYTDDPIGQW